MLRRFLVAICIGIVLMMTFAGCSGSSPDGGWVASGPNWAYYIEISNGTGPVDYAYPFQGQVRRFHGVMALHNDGTIEVAGFYDGALKDCSACPYHMTNGNFVIDYTYNPYSGGTEPVSGTMTFSTGNASDYNNAIQAFHTSGG